MTEDLNRKARELAQAGVNVDPGQKLFAVLIDGLWLLLQRIKKLEKAGRE